MIIKNTIVKKKEIFCFPWFEEQKIKPPKVAVQSPRWRVIDNKQQTITLNCE
jgi:hypothetical protein